MAKWRITLEMTLADDQTPWDWDYRALIDEPDVFLVKCEDITPVVNLEDT